jgi:RNA polymerase sigma-70 factor, ECF subfamily
MFTPFSAAELLAEIPRLRRYARILTDDPQRADHLVEETLARARQMRDESALASTRGTQLLALLRSAHANDVERRDPPDARAAFPAPPAHADADPKRGPAPSPPDRGAEILAQLWRLPFGQREILVLVAVERMSYAEIASLLDLPVATVIARLSQARETLRSSVSTPLSAPKNAS